MANILYSTPPPHRTHHDPTFDLSPAVFAFELTLVKRKYRDRIAEYDEVAKKYIVGRGHKLERQSLNDALHELDAISGEFEQQCPDTVAATFATAMRESVYDQFRKVHCQKCDAEYDTHSVTKTKWVVNNGDGSGSEGSRLVCPRQHVLYASINTVID